MEDETMRPITTLITVALAFATGGACGQDDPEKQAKQPVHISIPPPVPLPEHFWTLELIQPTGEIYRTSYPSKEACEAAINGHCVEHKEPPDR
jgi:hypothetical protein